MAQRYFISLLTLSMFALLAWLPARAASPPSGSYRNSCQVIKMDGTTLNARCKNYFGNLQNTSLAEADKCYAEKQVFAAPKQDIANVNGFLRCVFLNDPNNLGIISMTKHEKDDRTETLVWRVDQPEVKAPEAFYSVIKFKPGDMISISAGGCVQTGGSGWEIPPETVTQAECGVDGKNGAMPVCF